MANDTQATESEAPVDEQVVTDTAEAQPSEASSQEVEAPEATQEQATSQEDVEQTEVEAEDTAEEKLYAGKYKSPEDMEKAYQELQSKFSQTTSEKAELSKVLNEAFLSSGGEQKQTTDTDDYDDYSTDSKSDPRVDQLERRTVVQDFIFNHPDADGESMKEVLASDPHVQNIGSYDAKLEYAYYKSQTTSQSKAVKQAEQQGAMKAKAKVAEKQTAQVESARKAEPTDEKSELYSKATTGTPEERNAARLEYIKNFL